MSAASMSTKLFAHDEMLQKMHKIALLLPRYYFYLINRPILVLKCEQGFVGYKTPGSTRLECNKAAYATIQVIITRETDIIYQGDHVDLPAGGESGEWSGAPKGTE